MKELDGFLTQKIHRGTVTVDGERFNVVLMKASDNSYDIYAQPYKAGYRPLKEGLPGNVGYVVKRTDETWVAKNAGVLLEDGELLNAIEACIEDQKWLDSINQE